MRQRSAPRESARRRSALLQARRNGSAAKRPCSATPAPRGRRRARMFSSCMAQRRYARSGARNSSMPHSSSSIREHAPPAAQPAREAADGATRCEALFRSAEGEVSRARVEKREIRDRARVSAPRRTRCGAIADVLKRGNAREDDEPPRYPASAQNRPLRAFFFLSCRDAATQPPRALRARGSGCWRP